MPKALATREAGANIVNIAQVFQRSGTLQVSFADSGITSPADWEGKTVGNWGFGNEYEIFAALAEVGLDPATDVTLVQQDFDMSGLLAGDIDAAEAMTYNEYAQVLEAVNPETGELYQPEDLNVVSYEEFGVGMLQDAIWADGERLASDDAYRDIAVRFVTASLQGWAYCRDNVQECTDLVVAQGSKLGDSHQLWQMNEINKLIWPRRQRRRLHRPGGVGPDGRDRAQHAEPRGHDRAHATGGRRSVHERHHHRGAREPRGARRRHQRRGLRADRGHARRGWCLNRPARRSGRGGRAAMRPARSLSPAGYQTSPGRQSQLIGADRSSSGELGVRRTNTYPSSSGVRTSPDSVRTEVGPCHTTQPRRS